MKNLLIVNFILLILVFFETLVGCSSQPRTKWTDPNMRIMVDGDGLSSKDYVRIVHALQTSGKWFVVDRRDAYRAIKREQERLHRNEVDRFADEEKYAIWGRMYGVGAVVIGHSQCKYNPGWFTGSWDCLQNLAIVSAISGQVIATAEGHADDGQIGYESGDVRMAADWTNTVEALNESFPKEFHEERYDQRMRLFRAEAKEEALRQKRNKADEEIDSQWVQVNK